MIDIALADIYSFASGVQKLRLSEDILDKLCSRNEKIVHFKKYIANKRGKNPFRKDADNGMSLRKEMLFGKRRIGYIPGTHSVHFQKISLSDRLHYNPQNNNRK